jgi:hypothetical protein
MALAGHVAYMTCRANSYNILVGKPERKRKLICKREYNIKMYRKEVKCRGEKWLKLGSAADFCEHDNDFPDSIETNFLGR